MLGQGQGIGQDRSLCNGRSYKGYEVMVCFILFYFTPIGSRSRYRSVPYSLQRTFLLKLQGYSTPCILVNLLSELGANTAPDVLLGQFCAPLVDLLFTFYIDTVGFNYGVSVKVQARTVVFAMVVPTKTMGLEQDLFYLTPCQVVLNQQCHQGLVFSHGVASTLCWVKVKVQVGTVVFSTVVPTGAMGLEWIFIYFPPYQVILHNNRGVITDYVTGVWYLFTYGFNYGVKVKVQARTVVYATVVSTVAMGLDQGLFYLTPCQVVLNQQCH